MHATLQLNLVGIIVSVVFGLLVAHVFRDRSPVGPFLGSHDAVGRTALGFAFGLCLYAPVAEPMRGVLRAAAVFGLATTVYRAASDARRRNSGKPFWESTFTRRQLETALGITLAGSLVASFAPNNTNDTTSVALAAVVTGAVLVLGTAQVAAVHRTDQPYVNEIFELRREMCAQRVA